MQVGNANLYCGECKYMNTHPNFIKPNGDYQEMKCVKPVTSLDKFNIYGSYVAREASVEQCDLGIIYLPIY